MLGVLVNTGAVIVGSLLGLLLRRGVPVRIADALQKGIALCIMIIGISGALEGDNTLIMILSIVIGVIIGEGIDLDRLLNRLTAAIERRLLRKSKADPSDSPNSTAPGDVPVSTAEPAASFEQDAVAPKKAGIAQGMLSASLVFCVGAMAVIGSLESGLLGDHSTLYIKSLLDFIVATVLASSLGIGVMLSAVVVFLYQGSIALLASVLAPLLSAAVVAEITAVGSLLIFALGLNMIGLTKLKILNFLPAVFLPLLLCPLYEWIAALF